MSVHPEDCDCDECIDTVIASELEVGEPPRAWDPADLEIEFDENWWDEL